LNRYNGKDEKRKFERLKRRSILHLNNKTALLEDISEEGILVSAQEVPAYPEVSILIKLLKSEFEIKGKIKWRSSRDDFSGLFSIGIELIDPPEKFRKLIKRNLKNPGK